MDSLGDDQWEGSHIFIHDKYLDRVSGAQNHSSYLRYWQPTFLATYVWNTAS
jgi:hypothetical protein